MHNKKALTRYDIIFMVSDGVPDAFGSKETVADAIASLSGFNPQEAGGRPPQIMTKRWH